MCTKLAAGFLSRIKTTLALAVVAIACAAPSAALAQVSVDPTADQYDSTLTQISVGGQPPTDPSAPPPGNGVGGSLPFTGLDLAALAAVAIGFGAAGIAIRRRSAESEPVN